MFTKKVGFVGIQSQVAVCCRTCLQPASVQSCDMPQALQPAHNFSTHATIHTVLLSPEQRKKLRRELDVVSGNVCVMSEMLAELSPTGVEIADFELLQVCFLLSSWFNA